MTRANFTDQGLPVGQNDVNMTYMYGLSDFFTIMFQDTSTVNLLLETTTQSASDIYSQFLQLTSTLSLAGIEETIGSSIKLIMISSADAVIGEVNQYVLSDTVLSSRYIANRPFLPTSTLESNIDFGVTTDVNGVTTITFAQPLETYGFSLRAMNDGSQQYALWFVDVEIDERLISKYYGNLIGIDPQNSTDTFSNFVYGLYYVYVQGPTLDVMRKGLNLVLGIPLARSAETVLDIRNYLDTDQFIVITDQNQYLIPFGLSPSVSIGDVLAVGDELAQWVVIKDYISDGEWWINLQIPPSIIPTLPAGQKDRYATEGSHFDYLMRNYLKKHTFLVNINVANFENIQSFAQLSDIINKAKPTYTQPIYIWSVDTLLETITLTDDQNFTTRIDYDSCENIGLPIERFYRNNSTNPVFRSCPQFTRFNTPGYVSKLCGTDPYINGDEASMSVMGSPVTGFTNYVKQYRTNTETEQGWLRAIIDRGSETWRGAMTQVGFRMNALDPSSLDGVPSHIAASTWGTPVNARVIPLYITTQTDIESKCATLNVAPPSLGTWFFPLFGANSGSRAINAIGINAGPLAISGKAVRANFNLMCFRDPTLGYLGSTIPDDGWVTYAPTVNDILDSDYLLGVRIADATIGVYWVTTNYSVVAPSYFPVSEIDPLVITYDMPLTRAGGLNGTPFYTLRGRGNLDYNNLGTAINASGINAPRSVGSPILEQEYIDKYNSANVTIDRSGIKLVHAIESN